MKFECIKMSVIIIYGWTLLIIGSFPDVDRARAHYFSNRNEVRGVPQSVPLISPAPFLDLWSVVHPMPTARRIFSVVGQTPCQPRGKEGAQKRAWVRGWHLARLGWYGREIIWKCHASNPSDTELFFYSAIKFKIEVLPDNVIELN